VKRRITVLCLAACAACRAGDAGDRRGGADLPSATSPPAMTTHDATSTLPDAESGLIPARAGLSEPSALPIPPTEPFVSDPEFAECVHPGVEANCSAGWCRIPTGCFVWGSPETEPLRAQGREERRPVSLTHTFELGKYEVTVAEWEARGFELPELAIESRACGDPSCAADGMPWIQAAAYANAVSLAHDPPLDPCYSLGECRRYMGAYRCDKLELSAPTVYECAGYRLPTRAEWQYAARAGTTTSYYSGDLTVLPGDVSRGCAEDPNLNPIAWYCYNSSQKIHPVGGKWSNAWGLHDILGNVDELVNDRDLKRSPEEYANDPFGEIGIQEDARPRCGGSMIGLPFMLRAAAGLSAPTGMGMSTVGFRLARTLFD
jgi:formylglycine-generating enzyme